LPDARHSFLPISTNISPSFRIHFYQLFKHIKKHTSYYSLSRMLNLSVCLSEKGRHSYSLSLSFYTFHSSPPRPLILRECSVFHSTHKKSAAHLVVLACSIAKSFTKAARLIFSTLPVPQIKRAAFVRVQTYQAHATLPLPGLFAQFASTSVALRWLETACVLNIH
jgi:hypothetical protein